MERQSVVELLKLNVRHEFSLVLGWYLHEILASLEVASALLLDAEIRSLLLRHVMQAQSYYDSKTERSFLHLVETRPLATFIASFISHNLSSSSSPPSSPSTPLFSSSPSIQTASPIPLSSLSSSTSSLTSSCGLSSSTSSIISSISTLAITSPSSLSSSLSSMMMVLTRQQQGLFPFLLLHIDEPIVYNCFESILRNFEKPVELHMIIGRAICTEFMFQSPKVINGNLIWKVEKLANLLSTFIETMGDNFTQLGSSVAAMVEPLSHFILKFTNASFCSELSFLRLANLIITNFSSTPALRNLVPHMIQSVSFSFPSLTSSLRDDSIHNLSENSGERRRDRLNVVALFEGILKYTAEYPQVMENMVAHNVVEKVCKVAFSPTDCSSSFFHLSLSFLRSVLSSGFTYLITPSLIKDLTVAVNNSPKRHKHFTALSQEMSKIPELAPLFSGENSTPEIPIKKRSPRQSLKLALTQPLPKEKIISKYLRQIFRSEEHPYGMVVSDFGRRIAKGFQLEDDKEKMLNDIKNTVDTFAKSVAETIRIEERVINLPVFDLSSLCLEASFEVILSREPTVVLHFYRTKFIAKDRKLQSVIKAWGHKVTPRDLHVPDHFLTKEELNKETVPFGEAIDIFKRFMSKKSPLEKVRKLKATVTSICGRTPSKNSSEHGTPISADDLMAIFTYVILKTEVKTLVSDSEFMGDFLGKHNLAGEPGYLVTTLQCCCMFIASGEFMEMMKNVGQDNLDKSA